MASPEASSGSLASQQHETNLASSLVNHLSSAKQALSSTTQVYRANELTVEARNHIELTAILSARNEFLKPAVDNQLGKVVAIQEALKELRTRSDAEFREILKALDKADDDVNEALDQLRRTTVDSNLQPLKSAGIGHGVDGRLQASIPGSKPKTLHDFIETAQVDAIRSYFHGCIDEISRVDGALFSKIESLESRLSEVRSIAALEELSSSTTLSKPAIANLFTSLEEHASDMAVSLQALVKHYDLCAKAINNIEGAKEAIAAKLDVTVEDDGVPIADEEFIELVQVIRKDAEQVDEVVGEIDDNATSIEMKADQISQRVGILRAESDQLKAAAVLLQSLGADLPSCSQAAFSYMHAMAEQLDNIRERLPDMSSASQAFRSYHDGYLQMVQEVDRRKLFKLHIAELYDEEAEKRQDFLDDWGHTLPSDFMPFLQGDPRHSDQLFGG